MVYIQPEQNNLMHFVSCQNKVALDELFSKFFSWGHSNRVELEVNKMYIDCHRVDIRFSREK